MDRKQTNNDLKISVASIFDKIRLSNADCSNYFLHWILSRVVLTVKAKQQVHGPHRSSEQQFESKNTFAQSYDYIILRIKWSSVWKKVFFNQGCFVPSLRGTVEAVYRKFIDFNTKFKTIAFIYRPFLFWALLLLDKCSMSRK